MLISNILHEDGQPIPGHRILVDDTGAFFYESHRYIIVKRTRTGEVYLDEKHFISDHLTMVLRNRFLGVSTAGLTERLNAGEYELVNLNEDPE